MSLRVLIADDSQAIRGALRTLFQSTEFDICGETDDGHSAVELASKLKPDIIILDLAMPTMNGLEAARRISCSMPNVPIVLHTLHAHPQLRLEAENSGVWLVVPKALGHKIVSLVRNLMKQRPLGQSGLLAPAA